MANESGKVIAFLNFKGGVGKTTLAAHCAWVISQRLGKKVCAIDLDPQFNLSQLLFNRHTLESVERQGTNAHRLFVGGISDVPPAQYSRHGAADPYRLTQRIGEANPPLHVIPGSFDLMQISLSHSRIDNSRATSLMFREALDHCRSRFAFTILDLNPGGSILTYLATDAADLIVTPITGDKYSWQGLKLIHEFVASYIPSKAYPERFAIVENMVSEEEAERRNTQKSGELNQARRFITQNKFFSPALIAQFVPHAHWLRPEANSIGVAFNRKPPETEKQLFDAMTAALLEVSTQLVTRVV